MGYEECRDELIEVVRLLEQGGLDLDASLKLWERGEQLAKRCEEHLAGARKRVEDALAAGDAEKVDSATSSLRMCFQTGTRFSYASPPWVTHTLTTDLGRVLVTGGSGFVGANLVTNCSTADTRSAPSTAHRRRCPRIRG